MVTWPLDNTQYTAAAIGAFCACNTRGVFNKSNDFSVSSIGGLNLQVSKGLAWLKKSEYWGVSVLNEDSEILTAEVGHGQLSRTIAVTLRLDKSANNSYLLLKYSDFEGTGPLPVRDEYYDEIILAYVLQKAGSSSFSSADITDTRLDESLCGVMKNSLTGVDTDVIHDSATELLDGLRQALVDVSNNAGVLLNEVYDPELKGIDITNQEYTHIALGELSGLGANGYFTATFSGTVETITINGIEYIAKQGASIGIDLESDALYSFIIVGDTINFKSGGGGLSIKIVGGTERPTSPKENTIWVKDSYYENNKAVYNIGYNYPTNPNDGDLFFVISNEKNAYVHVNNKQTVEVSLSQGHKWNAASNKWNVLSFETYAGGEWHDGIVYIILNGEIATQMTFGAITVAPVISYSNNQVRITPNGSSRGFYRTKELVDLTNYTTLKIDYVGSYTNSRTVAFGISNNPVDDIVSIKRVLLTGQPTGIYELDISNVSGEYYIGVGIWIYESNNYIVFKSIWLE